jgi:septum formation protein
MKNLILASGSPRRKDILNLSGFSFQVVVPNVDETPDSGWTHEQTPAFLAERKSQRVSAEFLEAYVLGFDTLVFHKGQILSKPESPEAARSILHQLNNDWHQVITGICICHKLETLYLNSEITDVHFKKCSSQEIDDYISTGEPFDKAGAYGIQGYGARFVKSVKGCYYNVVGLPLVHTLNALRALSGEMDE